MKVPQNQNTRHNYSLPRLRRGGRTSLVAALCAVSFALASFYLMSPPKTRAINGVTSLTVVISQVYGGAGCGTAGCSTYQNDFIELYNRSTTPISLNGWSVQYAAATGTAWQVTALPNVTLQPGQYFLVAESFGANGVSPLPTPDATGTIAMSATTAKVALVNCTTALTGACPSNVTGTCAIIDFVGYGTTANCNETGTNTANNAPAPSTTSADIRAGGGNTDTDTNNADFATGTPTPRNTASTLNTPTAIKLASFTARRSDGGTLLEWQTGFEVDNLGFNIYRESAGSRTRITPQIVAGSALSVGARTALQAGQSYSWYDSSPAAKDARYWLEEIDLNGQSQLHGPVTVDRTSPPDRLPPGRGAKLLGALGNNSAITRPVERAGGEVVLSSVEQDGRANLAGRRGVKMEVTREGWYRVTRAELAAAGLAEDVDPRSLQLYVEGREQAILVEGEADGKFDESDTVEFYGYGMDNAATDRRVYWLVAGTEAGKRVEQVRGKGQRSAGASFLYTVERKDRTVYFSSLKNGEKENFFGAVITKQPVDQSLAVRHADRSSASDATLEVTLQGVTNLPHRVRVELNETALGELTFDSQAQGSARFSINHSRLKEGDNQVRLAALGGDSDISLVDTIRLSYRHTFTAEEDALKMTLAGRQKVTISGLSSPSVRVIDITDPLSVRQIAARVEQSSSGYSARFKTPDGESHNLLVVSEQQVKRPVEVAANTESDWRSKDHEADLVIIAHRQMIGSVERLKAHRQAEGLSVAVVDVEDIFDEFSYGQKSPEAIREFLREAGSNWRKAPRFVLLVGDASLDAKNYLGKGDFDFVPTKLIDTQYMETASDDWYADFDGDGLAEMAVGRLPARTADEAALLVGKILSHDSSSKAEGVLLIADSGDDGVDFDASTARLRGSIPGGVMVESLRRADADAAATKSKLLRNLNRGQKVVNYTGHGSVNLWRGGLLNGADAGELTNADGLSVFVMMTCLNGYFHDVELDSLAESLLKAERGGAVAVWASSGMCDIGSQVVLDQELFRLLFDKDNAAVESLTLGEAMLGAKAAVGDRDVRRTWILFGDPTSRLR